MNNKSGFTLVELMVSMIILGILVAMGIGTFTTTQKKSRDSKRKNDIRQISVSLEAYYNDIGHYPYADGNGNMMGCGLGAASVCWWGQVWSNTSTTPETIYMLVLPSDLMGGNNYFYTSDASGTFFKIYALLENEKDESVGVNQDGYAGTDCGPGFCTYGTASTNVSP